MAGLLLAVVIGNMIVYFLLAVPDPTPMDPEDAPLSAAVIVDPAIQDYADDHNGQISGTLDQLMGTYLTRDDIDFNGNGRNDRFYCATDIRSGEMLQNREFWRTR